MLRMIHDDLAATPGIAPRAGPAQSESDEGSRLTNGRPGDGLPKVLDAAQERWRKVNAPRLVALVMAGATLHRRSATGKE